MTHTPTPWVALPTAFNEGFTISAQPSPVLRGFTKQIAFVGDKADEETKANAAFIVKAVNAHDELVAALKGCLDALLSSTEEDADYVEAMIRRSNAALAKAGAL
jgi:hypothetical protein